MIINAFKNGIFSFRTNVFPEGVDREDEDKDEFYIPRGELETIPEFLDFENEEEIPVDIPKLDTEESAAENRN